MKQIIFLTSYPTDHTLKDGMVQRVKNIDNLFVNQLRIYLDIKLWTNFGKKRYSLNTNIREYKLNAFLHFFIIWKLISKSDIVYLHSIHGLIKIFIQLFFLRKEVCLDMHGIVPEENLIENGRVHYLYLMVMERIAVFLSSKIIYVSIAMKRHFNGKYASISKKALVYPIFANINSDHIPSEFPDTTGEGNSVFIYSGNLQSWQNIDEMLKIIAQFQQKPNFRFIILTGDPDSFKRQILNHKISLNSIEVLCVNSDEIDQYYRQAHYGFILRSEHIVNQVANPTKMIEYLLFGIIPIVKSTNIGDFDTYPYEFVRANEFNDQLLPRKSKINQKIAFEIIENRPDLYSFVMNR